MKKTNKIAAAMAALTIVSALSVSTASISASASETASIAMELQEEGCEACIPNEYQRIGWETRQRNKQTNTTTEKKIEVKDYELTLSQMHPAKLGGSYVEPNIPEKSCLDSVCEWILSWF
ncbi:MAG: hypothetical protein J6I55_00275 [Ruminococcus sp.]|nr:hypothetical protein [Ruminococcus sp.]